MQRDEAVIQDILNAGRLVVAFVDGFEKHTFREKSLAGRRDTLLKVTRSPKIRK